MKIATSHLDTITDYSRKMFDLTGKETPLEVDVEALKEMRNLGISNTILLMNYSTMKVHVICGNVEQVIGCKREMLDNQHLESFYGLMTPKHRARFAQVGPELAASVVQRVKEGTINDTVLNIQNQITYRDKNGREKWMLAQVFLYFIQDGERVGAAIQMTDISPLIVQGKFSVTLFHKKEERVVHEFVSQDPESVSLTQRETEIVEWLYQGKMEKEIADLCGISVKTVKNHKQNLFKKLKVSRTVEALMRLEELGIL